jgi:hypothetical protein
VSISFATASAIARDALERHGSLSQCDLSTLLSQLDRSLSIDEFIAAADAAAEDLVGC